MTDEDSSSREGPIAITVKTMIISLTTKTCATSTAPHTKTRELKTRKERPAISQNKAVRSGITGTLSDAFTSMAKLSDFFFIPCQMVQAIITANTQSKTRASKREISPSHICQAANTVTKARIGSSLRNT